MIIFKTDSALECHLVRSGKRPSKEIPSTQKRGDASINLGDGETNRPLTGEMVRMVRKKVSPNSDRKVMERHCPTR